MKAKELSLLVGSWMLIFSVLLLGLFITNTDTSNSLPVLMTGIVAYSFFLFDILLSSRFLSRFGLNNLNFLYFSHGISGIAGLEIISIHALLGLIRNNNTRLSYVLGVFAFLCLLAVVFTGMLSLSNRFTSLNVLKRELGLKGHRISLFFVVVSYFHFVTSDVLNQNTAFRWVAGLLLVAVLSAYFLVKLAIRRLPHFRVAEKETIGNKIHKLVLEPENKGIKYQPGQYFFLRFTESMVPKESHPFSSTSFDSHSVSLMIKESGDFTSQIGEVTVNDQATLEGPYGNLFSKKIVDAETPIVLLAGGIGITPFLSILDYYISINATRKIVLCWSLKKQSDIYFMEELEKKIAHLDNIELHLTFSREEVPPYHFGRINQEFFVKNGIDEYVPEATFFLCGPKGFVSSMRTLLQGKEVPAKRIRSEAFEF